MSFTSIELPGISQLRKPWKHPLPLFTASVPSCPSPEALTSLEVIACLFCQVRIVSLLFPTACQHLSLSPFGDWSSADRRPYLRLSCGPLRRHLCIFCSKKEFSLISESVLLSSPLCSAMTYSHKERSLFPSSCPVRVTSCPGWPGMEKLRTQTFRSWESLQQIGMSWSPCVKLINLWKAPGQRVVFSGFGTKENLRAGIRSQGLLADTDGSWLGWETGVSRQGKGPGACSKMQT